jgi:twitching motility two-component system response regulator PilG
MQGTLNEIDIRSILQLIELGQRTGELYVEAYNGNANTDSLHSLRLSGNYTDKSGQTRGKTEQFWFVFFINGQIAYAADNNSGLGRLRDYLNRYTPKGVLEQIDLPKIAATNAPEYAYLWALIENDIITPSQAKSIIQSMIQETLFDLCSLHHGSFIFEIAPSLSPQLTTLEIAPIITTIMKQLQEWKQFHPHIYSPNQCLTISDAVHLSSAIPSQTFQTLSLWADGKTSLRQLARYLNRDILTVAKAIYPYIQQGLIQLSSPNYDQQNPLDDLNIQYVAKIPQIICIDDDITIGKIVEDILSKYNCVVTAINDPIDALSRVFKIKPDLIFCDIAMPNLDGYEICAMLRRSTVFRSTPLIMLTGMDGFIDRVRARMVGATDYLTKPFGETELLILMEKYIKTANPSTFIDLSSQAANFTNYFSESSI